MNTDHLEDILDITSEQWGLITTAQAQSCGISKMWIHRALQKGILIPIRHGVHALFGSDLNETIHAKAQWLALDMATPAYERIESGRLIAVASHTTAASMYGIGDLMPRQATFTTPHWRHTRQKAVKFVVDGLPEADITYMDGFPVTTVLRTVEDLARAGTEPDHLLVIIEDAYQRHGTPIRDMADRLSGIKGALGSYAGTTDEIADYLHKVLEIDSNLVTGDA